MNTRSQHTAGDRTSSYNRRTLLARGGAGLAAVVGLAGCSDNSSSSSPGGSEPASPSDPLSPVEVVQAYYTAIQNREYDRARAFSKEPHTQRIDETYVNDLARSFEDGAEILDVRVSNEVEQRSDIVLVQATIEAEYGEGYPEFRVVNTTPDASEPTWRIERQVGA